METNNHQEFMRKAIALSKQNLHTLQGGPFGCVIVKDGKILSAASQTVMELFDKLYNRRMRIRLIGVRFTNLVRGSLQINIFEDTQEMVSLYQAMDKIRDRFGSDKVGRASGFRFAPKEDK